jgi:hypothetical protein
MENTIEVEGLYIPSDMIDHILSFIDDPETLLSVSSASKQYATLFNLILNNFVGKI